jgi:hypothetical protein
MTVTPMTLNPITFASLSWIAAVRADCIKFVSFSQAKVLRCGADLQSGAAVSGPADRLRLQPGSSAHTLPKTTFPEEAGAKAAKGALLPRLPERSFRVIRRSFCGAAR